MTAQAPTGAPYWTFGAAYVVLHTNKQEQAPNTQYVLEGTSPATLPMDASNYFLAC